MKNITNTLQQILITLSRPSISPISLGQTSGLVVHAFQ